MTSSEPQGWRRWQSYGTYASTGRPRMRRNWSSSRPTRCPGSSWHGPRRAWRHTPLDCPATASLTPYRTPFRRPSFAGMAVLVLDTLGSPSAHHRSLDL
ncbi:hypothetical protein ACIRQP_38465 [Streptomyces sp. NPDC102274]|uniref:hypothetical protein n=1 Tax=Streptomyces sp. NPDC102274 TaxID=3366151 RepID=UPI0037F3115C